jgi:PAX-interacting protein 1
LYLHFFQEDYVKRIAHKLVIMEHNQQRVLQAASASNQQVQTGCQMQPVNRIQEAHGGNSSITAMPTMGSHERQSSQVQSLPITPSGLCPVQEQHMSDPVALNMHTKNRQTDAVPMSDKILKPYPAIVSSSSPGVHPSQMMQQGEGHTQNKLLTMQMQQINFSSGNATSVPPSQGKPVQPNEQQNLLSHNSRGNCTLPQQQLRMNQQGPEVNQQKMNKHNSQFLAAKQVSISDMHTGHPREWNSQQNAGMNVGSPLQKDKHIENENSAYGLHSATPQTGGLFLADNLVYGTRILHAQCFFSLCYFSASTGNAEEIDWREEMFQQVRAF